MLREMPIKTQTTFEEFLEFEMHSQVRHEFVDGNLFVMSGGTDRHNHIISRLIVRLFEKALSYGAALYQSDVLVRVPSGKGYYPDVYVCFDQSLDSARVKHRPSIIIEILSESTEAIDRGEKWQAYQQIPSLEQYILLSQTEPVAEVFVRHNDKWIYSKLENEDVLELPQLEAQIVLSNLFENLPPLET
jgi:Uma2 family endonuclease